MVVLRNGPASYSCKVLYIGSAVPFEEKKGVEALQAPLRERYPIDFTQVEGIDCTISVLWDCLEVKYRSTDHVIRFPLSRLTICAAVRCVLAVNSATGEQSRQFVPVNEYDGESEHPAIFSMIVRRSKGRQILESHSYICNSTRDALHLVNSTASANIALKEGRKQNGGTRYVANGQSVVNTAPQGYATNTHTNYIVNNTSYEKPQIYHETQSAAYGHTVADGGETVYIKSTVDESHNYAPSPIPVQQDVQSEASTIYIEFDKTNLVAKSEDTLQVKHQYANQSYENRRHTTHHGYDTHGYDIVEKPVYVDMPPPPPMQPYVIEAPKYVMRSQPPPPPPPPPQRQVVYAQPRPPPPPQRQVVYAQPPPPQMYSRPLPMPPPMIIANPPPTAQRIYAKRAPAAYGRRFFSPQPQPPVELRNTYYRARSASPHYAATRTRVSRGDHGKYQPKWQGTSEIGDYRKSRRDESDYSAPPRDFRRDENMFLNERAFSRRITADHRISRGSPQHNYPTAYELHDAMEVGTPKSNPRYSSSSESEAGGRHNNRRT